MTRGFISFQDARATQVSALEALVPRIAARLAETAPRLSGPGPIFVGIGASYAAAAAPVWALRQRGLHSWRLSAGDQPLPYPPTVHPIVGISQSGRSAETLAVLEALPEEQRIAVVNVAPSPIAALPGTVIGLGDVSDSYASTIGFTATVTALGMIADAWAGGAVDAGWSHLHEVFAEFDEAVRAPLAALASVLERASYADFVGAGRSLGSAEAGALLLREVARIPSTGMSTRQYLHGSMESAGDGLHVVIGDERELALARTLSEAGHHVLVVTSAPVAETRTLHPVTLPELPPAQRAVLDATVLQNLAAVAASARGIDIEQFVFHNDDTKVTAGAGR